jgi:hypothetical protein
MASPAIPYVGNLAAPQPKVTFFGGSTFFSILEAFRTMNVRGRFGGGKTALSCMVAYELVRRGVVSNIWSNFQFRYGAQMMPPLSDGVMDLDEAAEILDARTFSSNNTAGYMRYLRKFNLYILLPSVFAVDVRFRTLVVEPFIRLGNYFWWFRWFLEMGTAKDRGFFWVLNPKEMFSVYDTFAVTGMLTDSGFSDALDITVAIQRSKISKWNGKDFFLPWYDFESRDYVPEADRVDYTMIEYEKFREKYTRSKPKTVLTVGEAAQISISMAEQSGSKNMPTYAN